MSVIEAFLSAFAITERGSSASTWSTVAPAEFRQVMSEYGGSTFENGLYRLHSIESARAASEAIVDGFPELVGGFGCFGFDWLGRQFALDLRAEAANRMLLIDAGAGEVITIPTSFLDFHNHELVEQSEAALASSFFLEWSRANPGRLPLAHDVCIGYKTPLFLGGSDEVANLEPTSLVVYLSICGQLHRQLTGLPPGTTIGDVTIE